MDNQGLIGHWALDEGSGEIARDRSGNSHHGSITAAVWEAREGGVALQFDGVHSRVTIPDHEQLRLTADITICAWVQKFRSNRGERWDAILIKRPGSWDYEMQTSMAKSDELAFYSPACEPNEVYGGVPVSAGSWHHLASSRCGEEVVFYLDGAESGRAQMRGPITVSNGDLVIGHDGVNGRGHGMIGLIRDVMLFGRGLSAAQIVAIYGAGRAAMSGKNLDMPKPGAHIARHDKSSGDD